MTTNHRLTLTSLVLALGWGGCGEQPKNRCKVAPGLAIARYKPKAAPTGTCDNVALPLKGETVGIQPFVPDPNDPAAPDTPTSLSIKPFWLGARIADARDNAATDMTLASMASELQNYPYGSDKAPPPSDLKTTRRPYAFGRFAEVFPDDAGVCKAATMNVSELVYPAVPAHVAPDPDDSTHMKTISVPAQPETSVKYVWKNVRTVQIPQSPGTQTFADLTITRDGCTASYTAALLVPVVGCGQESGDNVVANPKACDPSPNDTNIFGSGISQGVPTECVDMSDDPAAPNFLCVPKKVKP
jgi:hypothetical protein